VLHIGRAVTKSANDPLRTLAAHANSSHVTQELLDKLKSHLVGRHCSIERREADWAVSLDGGGSISLPVPWRLVADGRIALADRDDGQQFGLPAPLDGQAEANRLIEGRAITNVSIDPETADLAVRFEGSVRLDAFNYSAGYEGWHINLPPEHGGMWVIALGGGDVTVFA
jgi:hypothetical protein